MHKIIDRQIDVRIKIEGMMEIWILIIQNKLFFMKKTYTYMIFTGNMKKNLKL